LAASEDRDEDRVLVKLAAEFPALAKRDIDLGEIYADLVFDLDRTGALVALFDPCLPG